MKNKIFLSCEGDPHYNLAIEEQLLKTADATILYLWVNDPVVIIGRNQNPYAECDLDYMKREGIKLARRKTGGGAVYQDRGNLNFSLIYPYPDAGPGPGIYMLVSAMKILDIKAECSGRNDLLVGGRKFSGHAYLKDFGHYLHHGTIMVDVDLLRMEKALTPSELKLETKGILSARERVCNLCGIIPELTIAEVSEGIKNAFKNQFGETESVSMIDSRRIELHHAEEYMSDEWNFGESPDSAVTLEKNICGGTVTVLLSLKGRTINKVFISTDLLSLPPVSKIAEALAGTEFCENEIWAKIEKYLKNYLESVK